MIDHEHLIRKKWANFDLMMTLNIDLLQATLFSDTLSARNTKLLYPKH